MGEAGNKAITVVVGDDHPLMREAMARSLASSPGVEVLAQADSRATILTAVRTHKPTVALVDLRLGDGDAFDVLRAARADRLSTRFLIISSFSEPALVHEALRAGAGGYLTKGAEASAVLDAVRDVADGKTVLAKDLQSDLLAEIARHQDDAGFDVALSPRELSALRLVAEGKKERVIAAELLVSGSSVKSYLRRAYEKLGASDRSSAVAEAVRRGLID